MDEENGGAGAAVREDNYPDANSSQVWLRLNRKAEADISKTFIVKEIAQDQGQTEEQATKRYGSVTLTVKKGETTSSVAKIDGDFEYVEDEGGVVTLEVPVGAAGSGNSKDVKLIPVDIVIPDISPPYSQGPHQSQEIVDWIHADSLEVANWEKSFEYRDEGDQILGDFVDKDPRRFKIRLPKFENVLPQLFIRNEALLESHDDPESEIELIEEPDNSTYWTTETQILVSDEDDDLYSENGAGADEEIQDRTHEIIPFGKTFLKLRIGESETEIELPVPRQDERREISLRFVIVRDAEGRVPFTEDEAWDHMIYVIERFAQANVHILPQNVERITVNQPPGVDMSDGLDIGPLAWYKDPAIKVPISDESKALIQAHGTTETSLDYTVFMVKRFKIWLQDQTDEDGNPVNSPVSPLGLAWSKASVGNRRSHLANNCVISEEAGINTTAHEVGHLITNTRTHYGGGLYAGMTNLMFRFSQFSIDNPRDVRASKRLTNNQIRKIANELETE